MKNLDSFFNAKSIAIIGASNTFNKMGNILIRKLKIQKGTLIPINKHEEKVEGRKAYKKITDYKKNVDLAVIAIPAKSVEKAVKQCGEKGIKNIIIISAGFSEDGNFKLEKKLIKIKEKYNLNILGPNSFGIINPKKNIDLTFSNNTVKKGSTVFLSQSGVLASYILDLEIKLRAFISLGNTSDLDFADWIEYFSKDRKTKRIVLYIDQLKNPKKFIDAAKKSKKEIIIIKSRDSKEPLKEKIYSGIFTQAKVKRANFLINAFGGKEEKIIYKLKGKKVAILTNAKEAGKLLTNNLESQGYKVHGPKNLLNTATKIDYRNALNKIKGEYDSIIVILTPQSMTNPEEVAQTLTESKYKNKIVACFLGSKSMNEAIHILRKNGITHATRVV